LNERERSGVCEYEREIVATGAVPVEIVVSIVPRASVRFLAIDDLGEPDDTAQGQHRGRANAAAPFDLLASHVVGALRRMDQNGSAITRGPGPVLDVFRSACDQ